MVNRTDFWTEVFAIRGSVSPLIIGRVFLFGIIGGAIWWVNAYTSLQTHFGIAPYEVVGAVIALLLVLRTNAGYDRWYEARKLWGGIVNQSRNLALIGVTYGPQDENWRRKFLGWVAAYCHVCRHSLRAERNLSDVQDLLGDDLPHVESAQHMPLYVAQRIGSMLRAAVDQGEMDRFAFLQAEQERASLIDHIGACERILNTPLAKSFSIMIRRFLFFYLSSLPCALADQTGALTFFVSMVVAYPMLALDQIGVELQNPFCRTRLSHLPLTEICNAIERNTLALMPEERTKAKPVLPHLSHASA